VAEGRRTREGDALRPDEGLRLRGLLATALASTSKVR